MNESYNKEFKIEDIKKDYLKIDPENLERQLKKISEVLLHISKKYNFSTFSHFGKLVELVHQSGNDPMRAKELLEKWDYSSLDFIKKEECGNCVDFAVLCQSMLFNVGIPVTIIGKYPDPIEFSKKQIGFMGYRHTSLLYANGFKDLELFMLEPGWKFPKPINIRPESPSGNSDWQFKTLGITSNELVRQIYNVNKKNTVRGLLI